MAAIHSFYSLLINNMPWHLSFAIESMKASQPCIHLCPIFHIVRDILQPSALKPMQAGLIQCLSEIRILIQLRFMACWLNPWWATLATDPREVKCRRIVICGDSTMEALIIVLFADYCGYSKYTNDLVIMRMVSLTKKWEKNTSDLTLN